MRSTAEIVARGGCGGYRNEVTIKNGESVVNRRTRLFTHVVAEFSTKGIMPPEHKDNPYGWTPNPAARAWETGQSSATKTSQK